jgi:cyclohexadienyl dehydratase
MRFWLVLALFMIGCRTVPPQRTEPVASDAPGRENSNLSSKPVLRVATSGDYAPFSFAGQGFDIDVAKLLAHDLGYQIEWVKFQWPELQTMMANSAADLAMSGITWRSDRALVGSMSRAFAQGGPCVIYSGEERQGRVAVNRGGALERWARKHFGADEIVTVDENQHLPELLANGTVDRIVTDTFELPHFIRESWYSRCEAPRDRKVYWISPSRAGTLTPRVDAWLRDHERALQQLRAQWFGNAAPRNARDHLVDLVARRFELMPAVGAYKREHQLAIEDREREAEVLAEVLDAAAARGFDRANVRDFFVEQIEIAKSIQEREREGKSADLATELRPLLSHLGQQILDALEESREILPSITKSDLDLLRPLVADKELDRLVSTLRQIGSKARP